MGVIHYASRWLIDLQVAAFFFMFAAWIANLLQRQPTKRLTLSRVACVAVLLFAFASTDARVTKFNVGLFKIEPPQQSTGSQGSRDTLTYPSERAIELQTSLADVDFRQEGTSPLHENQTHFQVPEVTLSVDDQVWKAVFVAYAFVAAAIVCWLAVGGVHAKNLVDRSQPVEHHTRGLVDMSVPTNVRIRSSSEVRQPLALGVFQPTILLPDVLLQDGFEKELQAIVAHELSHIRRGDLWMLCVTRLLMPVAFANPFFWLVRYQMRRDQEFLADQVAAQNWQPIRYAELLVSWSANPPRYSVDGALSWIAKGGLLAKRVRLLISDRAIHTSTPLVWRLCSAIPILFASVVGSQFTAIVEEKSVERIPSIPLQARDSSTVTRQVNLKNGLTLELVGVQLHPCSGNAFWNADGSFPRGATAPGIVGATEVIVRVINPMNVPFEWLVDPCDVRECKLARANRDDIIHQFAISVPSTEFETSFQLGIAVGDWQTQHMSNSAAPAEFRFGVCAESEDVTLVDVSHPLRESEVRLVAMDRAGCFHDATKNALRPGELTARFDDLLLDRIECFCVQSRPRHVVEFQNISLSPGQHTDARLALASSEISNHSL